jgi:inhibitor of KinA sporulation pathway (predicted exonuclease)
MNARTLLVVDLEATCWERRTTPAGEPQAVHNMEIIELGCALATRDGTLLDSRSFLVRPTRFPQLSEFCTALTSISRLKGSVASDRVVNTEEMDLAIREKAGQ